MVDGERQRPSARRRERSGEADLPSASARPRAAATGIPSSRSHAAARRTAASRAQDYFAMMASSCRSGANAPDRGGQRAAAGPGTTQLPAARRTDSGQLAEIIGCGSGELRIRVPSAPPSRSPLAAGQFHCRNTSLEVWRTGHATRDADRSRRICRPGASPRSSANGSHSRTFCLMTFQRIADMLRSSSSWLWKGISRSPARASRPLGGSSPRQEQ